MSDFDNKISKATCFKTKHGNIGFTSEEMNKLCEELNLDRKVFYDKLGCNTGMVIDGDCVTYRYDVVLAVRCVLENRDQKSYEWD